MKKNTDSGELTPKQLSHRTRDCEVKYGREGHYPDVKAKVEGLVMERQQANLDAERLRLCL